MTQAIPADIAAAAAPEPQPKPLGKKARNEGRVRDYFSAHLGCTHRECAAALGLSPETVGRYVRFIRLDWEGKRT